MKKSDFFSEVIIAFTSKHDEHGHGHDDHDQGHPQSLSASINIVYYEWSRSENKWLKLVDTDPEPPSELQDGKFDGQIIEVEL